MKKKILTDTAIIQCPKWGEETLLTEDIYCFFSKYMVMPIFGKRAKRVLDLITMIRNFRHCDLLINSSHKNALLLALLKRLFGLKWPKQLVLQFMMSEPSTSLAGSVKNYIQKLAYSNVDFIFVSSSSEAEEYAQRLGIAQDRIRFLPFHTNVVNPMMIPEHKGYFFSAGRSGRDFQTLIRAVEGTNIPLVIVSDQYHAKGLKVPDYVNILINIPYQEYVVWLKNCRFVVVPLKKWKRSAGQVVLLEGMGYGKPVIATEGTGTIDYVQHGYNGITVPPGDPDALRDAIEEIASDAELSRRIARNGLETVKKYHTFELYVDEILKKATEMIAQNPYPTAAFKNAPTA